jgi:predicted acylesterase/phospholipase RssA
MTTNPPENLSHQLTKEIRFAVVLYGGVSLAIYMNGITQELLSLARATRDSAAGSPDGTEAVYREIADHLSNETTGVFRHKFIVDIISGTSAGGINGVCLAKGLINGIRNLKALESTWLDEGTIDTLLNDKKSQLNLYCSKEPKTSLLNSQRMYGKLLDAFNEMEKDITPDSAALVNALDLFVTATDLRGIEVPVSLSDGKADEHIYKHAFHFLFRKNDRSTIDPDKYNHFTSDYNHILAFASRCTSSFPFAFEPMCLNDMLDYLKTSRPKEYLACSRQMEKWRTRFFRAYNELAADELNAREFADGGFLDNRPFGHAIKAVHARHATCPVERKLLFIDPSPEKSSSDSSREKEKKISFIKNTTLATTTLPRYETIREEIAGLKQRNRWIATVNQIVDTISDINKKRLEEIILQKFISYIEHPVKGLNASPADQKTRLILRKIEGSHDKGKADISLHALTENIETINILANNTALSQDEVAPAREAFWIAIIDDNKKQGEAGAKKAFKNLTRQIPNKTDLSTDKNDTEETPGFITQDLSDLITLYGDGYSAYHYTRIYALDDLLTLVITRTAEISDESDLSLAVRRLVEAWRKSRYQPYRNNIDNKEDQAKKELETVYLGNYDIGFRLRRLDYFRKLLQKALISNNAKEIIFRDHPLSVPERDAIHTFYETVCKTLEGVYSLRDFLIREGKENPAASMVNEWKSCFKKGSQSIKAFLNDVLLACDCSAPIPAVESKNEPCNATGEIRNEFRELLIKSGISTGTNPVSAELPDMMNKLMTCIHTVVMTGMPIEEGSEKDPSITGTIDARHTINAALDKLSSVNSEVAAHLLFIYDYGYDLHDITTLPLFSGGEYGEGSNIGIYRISPLDATSLFPEYGRNKDNSEETSKLAGTALGAFGAFLDRNWRRNDIMWGRLDGAERVITALLPNSANKDLRQRFIDKAHLAIITETVNTWLPELKRLHTPSNRELHLISILETIKNSLDNKGDWKHVFKTYYIIDHEPEAAPNLKRVGRSSDIVSRMINGVDGGNGFGKKISDILKMFSTVLLGMLDFTTPKSLKQVLLNYWLQLLFLIALLLSVTGTMVKGLEETALPGFYLLGAVMVIWIIKTVIENLIHHIHNKPWKNIAKEVFKYLASAILLFIAFISLNAFIDIWGSFSNSFITILHGLWNKIFIP